MSDDRRRIMQLDRRRRDARASLQEDVGQAKHDLNPRVIVERWKGRKRDQIASVADSTKQIFAKNAPLIGLAGAAILLFGLRKPISQAIQDLREKARQAKDRKS